MTNLTLHITEMLAEGFSFKGIRESFLKELTSALTRKDADLVSFYCSALDALTNYVLAKAA